MYREVKTVKVEEWKVSKRVKIHTSCMPTKCSEILLKCEINILCFLLHLVILHLPAFYISNIPDTECGNMVLNCKIPHQSVCLKTVLTDKPINPAKYHTFTEVIIPMQTE